MSGYYVLGCKINMAILLLDQCECLLQGWNFGILIVSLPSSHQKLLVGIFLCLVQNFGFEN